MLDFLKLLGHVLAAPFRTQAQLEAEITLLRHQLNVLRRQASTRPRLTAADRPLFVWLCRLFPSLRNAITIVQPDTVLRWHRSGFRLYWRWKSGSRGGRPKVPIEVRSLIRRMGLENPLWGAPRIHGELLKLGSRSSSRRLPSTWPSVGQEGLARRGRRSCATMRPALAPWTSLWCRRSIFGCCLYW